MRSSNSFNKLWIIESLADGELKTGTRLADDLFPRIKAQHPNLTVVLEQPSSKGEFLACLENICRDVCESQRYPLIHLECHGSEQGLSMANKDSVQWDEIRDRLIEINFACALNLLVVVAACKGVYLIKTATQLDRAPFYAVVGSHQEMKAGEVQEDFSEFYETFFSTLNGNDAIRALNRQAEKTNRIYHFAGAEVIFLKAFKQYHQDHCVGQAKRMRIERLVTQSLAQPEVQARGVRWARAQAKKWFREEQKPAFNRVKERFFGLDKYPQNAERFAVNYEDIFGRLP